MKPSIAVWPQYFLPQRLLTALAWHVSNVRAGWFRRPFIRLFIRLFGVKLDEAERTDPDQYECFNDFFTRSLKADARPLAAARHRLVSPCDGTISELGDIHGDTLIQAKGLEYTTAELLGDETLASRFTNGSFITIYLAPYDYHRVHAPVAGQVTEEIRIPGQLFSVSARTARGVPKLFARNERMVAIIETDRGPVAVVMVAALLVAGIETVWGGPADRRPGEATSQRKPENARLERGGELGRFHWGSTVIVLQADGSEPWSGYLQAGERVRMGQALTAATSNHHHHALKGRSLS